MPLLSAVVPFTHTEGPRDPHERANHLDALAYAAWWPLLEAANKADLRPLLDAYWDAARALVGFWENRARTLQRALTNVLATDALDEGQRRAVVRALHGSTARDASLLSRSEGRIIEQYRSLPAADKAMVRVMLDRLAKMAEQERAR
jgi:hypothetical protein